MLPPPSRKMRRVIDVAIMVALIAFGFALYPLTMNLFDMMPKQTMLVTGTDSIKNYLTQYAFDVSGRIEFVRGYSQHFEAVLGIPENASVELIHVKVSEFHKQYQGQAVCRHFAPLLFVMFVTHGYISGTRLKMGYVKSESTSIGRTIQGKTFLEPNHLWVEINNTLYEKGFSIRLGPLAGWEGKTYVEFGAEKIGNIVTFWYFLVGDLWMVTGK